MKKPLEESSNNYALSHAIILSENCDQSPNDEEIKLYADSIGIDLHKEPELIWLAKEGISAPVPKGWQVLQDENNQIFYYNSASGQSLWEHPLDAFYRNQVRQARLTGVQSSLESKPVKPTCETHPDGRSFCSTPTRGSVNLAPPTELRTSTPATMLFDKVNPELVNSGTKPSGPAFLINRDKKPDWIDAPVLGEVIPADLQPADSKDNVVPVTSENEQLTEYCELVPSQSKRYLLCQSSVSTSPSRAVTTQATASQTEDGSTAGQNVLLRNGVDLNDTGNRLTLLQAKLRASILADSRLSVDRKAEQFSKRSLPLITSSKFSPISPLTTWRSNHANNGGNMNVRVMLNPKHAAGVHPEGGLFFSPLPRTTEFDHLLSSCPELGVSPTESIADRMATNVNILSILKEQSTPSYKVGNTSSVTATTVATNTQTDKATEKTQIQDDESKPFIPKGPPAMSDTPCPPLHCSVTTIDVGGASRKDPANESRNSLPVGHPELDPLFNEGIGHLVEERARLQRKMLRIKLIYKTYKQRLTSLDASLRILQQTSGPNALLITRAVDTIKPVHLEPPITSSACKQKPNDFVSRSFVKPNLSHIASAAISPSSSDSNRPDDCQPSEQTVRPEIIDIREDSRACPASIHSLVTSHKKSRRSLSMPRHITPSWHNPAFMSTRSSSYFQPILSSQNRSVSQDLAHSLATIDAQLHSVVLQLRSGCSSAVCDQCVHEKHASSFHGNFSHTLLPSTCHHKLMPDRGGLRDLEDELHNLSIKHSRTERKSTAGDPRFMTPVSPDEQHSFSYQRPHVDVSPTWFQSD
ncbi:hypothetical protein EG68_08708 [Paragonimus skrjabini miyazakii]|uniref:WW domain-containing protein n=1 Tax=Paragonimus skrjabini miyazakii TaxID=59628 RepID=A0A8S9YN89_9TREM|nr:hypothetical protein EG68_08708 [Paragonimus skrjabini miyazakii]